MKESVSAKISSLSVSTSFYRIVYLTGNWAMRNVVQP